MALVAIGKIGSVNQTECGRREQFSLLALARGGLHQFGRVPFAEINLYTFRFEPAFEQVDLRGLARAIESLDGDQPPRKAKLRKGFHFAAPKLAPCHSNSMFFDR